MRTYILPPTSPFPFFSFSQVPFHLKVSTSPTLAARTPPISEMCSSSTLSIRCVTFLHLLFLKSMNFSITFSRNICTFLYDLWSEGGLITLIVPPPFFPFPTWIFFLVRKRLPEFLKAGFSPSSPGDLGFWTELFAARSVALLAGLPHSSP